MRLAQGKLKKVNAAEQQMGMYSGLYVYVCTDLWWLGSVRAGGRVEHLKRLLRIHLRNITGRLVT